MRKRERFSDNGDDPQMADDLHTEEAADLEATEPGLRAAIQNLADGVTGLVRDQFELLRVETKREATRAGSTGGRLAASAVVGVLGYAFSLLALVLGVGWASGVGAMAICAGVIGGLHLIGGLIGARYYLRQFEKQRDRIEQKTRTHTKAERWQKNNQEK